MKLRKILIINPYYYPGYRSGGPQQTFMNVIEAYGDEFDFYVLTLNHDMGCSEVYDNISEGWNSVGKAKVKYLSDGEYGIAAIAENADEMDIVYVGGFFEKTTIKAMFAHWFNKIKCPFWVAPMGVFSDGAFGHKKMKKELFVFVGKVIGLFKNINWSFTSEMELEDFKKHMGEPKKYEIASDIPRNVKNRKPHSNKEIGTLKIIFLSRICPKKNLAYAIDIVSKLKGNVIFDIYGTREDKEYWKTCEKMLNNLPDNIVWNYKGEVESSKVIDVFSRYDVFLFPTLGENFGHVIYEALAAGCVPVISDTTLWQELEAKNCGYVISLEESKRFADVIQDLVEKDSAYFDEFVRCTAAEAETVYKRSVNTGGYKRILDK